MNKEYIAIKDFNLKQYNSFEIASNAKDVFFPYSPNGVKELFSELNNTNPVILGNGTNTIFANEICTRPVIITSFLNDISIDNDIITVGSGVSLSNLSWFALEKSRTGFEYLEDIPGTVGGALYMNAGTYDDNIGNSVHSVMIYDFETKQVMTLDKQRLYPFWAKRDSYFQHFPCFIIACQLEAMLTDTYENILNRILTIKQKRYLKQPRNYPNAGSVFKRPYVKGEPCYVWKLIDDAGLRGYRIGDAQVSDKHPGFIVNVGKATGKDVVDLMNYCKQIINQKYNIELEQEWIIV